MPAARLVVDFWVKPGRFNDVIEAAKMLKKIGDRLGAHVRASRVRVGDPTHIYVVAEWADIAAWAKGQSDPELVALVEGIRNNANPPYETITVTMLEDIPL